MGKESLSLEEVAALLGESVDQTSCGNEAADLRSRLAGTAGKLAGESGLAASGARIRSPHVPDDWPWPPRLASRLAAAWTELLRTTVSVSVMHVEPATFGEFLLRSRYPTCLATATRPAGAPLLAADIPLAVACPAICRMLGSPLGEQPEAEQGLTQIEQRLAKRLVLCLVPEALASAGDPALPEAVPLMVHDRLPRVAPGWARTPAVRLEFRLEFGPVAGPLWCCVPWAT